MKLGVTSVDDLGLEKVPEMHRSRKGHERLGGRVPTPVQQPGRERARSARRSAGRRHLRHRRVGGSRAAHRATGAAAAGSASLDLRATR